MTLLAPFTLDGLDNDDAFLAQDKAEQAQFSSVDTCLLPKRRQWSQRAMIDATSSPAQHSDHTPCNPENQEAPRCPSCSTRFYQLLLQETAAILLLLLPLLPLSSFRSANVGRECLYGEARWVENELAPRLGVIDADENDSQIMCRAHLGSHRLSPSTIYEAKRVEG